MKLILFSIILILSNVGFGTKAEEERNIKFIKIVDCYDGDTCTSSEGEKIRLACIDTPELRGKKASPQEALLAKNYLNLLIKNKKVTLKTITKDRYSRTVGEIYLNKTNIQELLYKKGYAKIYRKYAYQCPWTSKYILD